VKRRGEKPADHGVTHAPVETEVIESRPVPSYHYQPNTEYITTTMATQPVAPLRWGYVIHTYIGETI
jgi:hypothetical protein